MRDYTDQLAEAARAFQNNQPVQANAILDDILGQVPEHPRALGMKGGVLASQGRYGAAIATLEQAISLSPHESSLFFNLGRCFQQTRNPVRAKQAFESAVRADADNLSAWLLLARIYQNRDELDQGLVANENIRRLAERHPETARVRAGAWVDTGKIALKQGNTDRAFDALQRALAENADDPRAHLVLGDVYRVQGKNTEAITHFMKTAALHPESTSGALNAAILHIREGHLDQAHELLTHCMEIAGDDRNVISAYTTLLWEMGRDDEYHEMLDYEAYVSETALEETPATCESMADFHTALISEIRNHPTLAGERATKATIGGQQTGNIFAQPAPATALLCGMINAKIKAYISDPSHQTDVPGVNWSDTWNLTGWGVILQAQGYQSAHNHPSGMVSGVYYIQVPDAVNAEDAAPGCIEFGSPNEKYGVRRKPPRHIYLPGEGSMFLFPSHFWHRTIPFDSREERIGIAFDAMPVRGAHQPPVTGT